MTSPGGGRIDPPAGRGRRPPGDDNTVEAPVSRHVWGLPRREPNPGPGSIGLSSPTLIPVGRTAIAAQVRRPPPPDSQTLRPRASPLPIRGREPGTSYGKRAMSIYADVSLEPGGIVAWLVTGLVAGFLAGRVMRGSGYGLIGDIV